jgi:hypothetical protein
MRPDDDGVAIDNVVNRADRRHRVMSEYDPAPEFGHFVSA